MAGKPQAELIPPRKFRPGERAMIVRKLKARYPELTTGEIAKRAGVSWNSAKDVLDRFLDNHSRDDLAQFQQSKAEIYDALQHRILDCVTRGKLAKTSAPALVTAAAILEDKARLVRGQATSINVNAIMDLAKLIREREE